MSYRDPDEGGGEEDGGVGSFDVVASGSLDSEAPRPPAADLGAFVAALSANPKAGNNARSP